eukprot:4215123-Prymnesium_polylepis.1
MQKNQDFKVTATGDMHQYPHHDVGVVNKHAVCVGFCVSRLPCPALRPTAPDRVRPSPSAPPWPPLKCFCE